MVHAVILNPWIYIGFATLLYIIPYLQRTALKKVPGPLLAKFSSLWLLIQCRKARRFQAVDNAHKRYGPLVRIQPDHVSVADADAIQAIYGHGNGFLKA